MKIFVVGFVVEPSSDQKYMAGQAGIDALEFKLISKLPDNIRVEEGQKFGYLIKFEIEEVDNAFWCGFNMGKYLGINIGARNCECHERKAVKNEKD